VRRFRVADFFVAVVGLLFFRAHGITTDCISLAVSRKAEAQPGKSGSTDL
jgi:hypothetical protein